MMRRKLVTQVQRTPEVCFFCAFRYSLAPVRNRIRNVQQSRSYISSPSRSRPAGAAAARQEEDEDEFPMLKNNAASHRPDEEQKPPPPPTLPSRQDAAQEAPTQRFGDRRMSSDQRPERTGQEIGYNALQRFSINRQQPSAPRDDQRSRRYEPDWTCGCGTINFARRTTCYRCRTPRSSNQVTPAENTTAQSMPNKVNSSQLPSPAQAVQTGSGTKTQDNVQQPQTNGQPATFRTWRPSLSFDVKLDSTQTPSLNINTTAPTPSKAGRQGLSGLEELERFQEEFSKVRRVRMNEPAVDPPSPVTTRESNHDRASDRGRNGDPAQLGGFQPFGSNNDRMNTSRDTSSRYNSREFNRPPRERQLDSGGDEFSLGGVQSQSAPGIDFDKDSQTTRRRFEREDTSERRRRMYGDLEDEVPASTYENVKNKSRRDRSKVQAVNFASAGGDDALMEELFDYKTVKAGKKRQKAAPEEEVRPIVFIPEFITVEKLAQDLKVRLNDFLRKLEEEGFEGARYDHVLDSSTSAMLAELYGFDTAVAEAEKSRDLVARPLPEDITTLPLRPPIVTIMGHVDHGKTTILDWLRKSSVVASEHGGITQHIGAFSVTMPGTERQITFLDTPGHAAFLDMRRRGANVTDIVVLVVAADDSVKPQTIEAIKHALEAKVQIIVAINKVDKEDANVDRVKQDLARHEITVEDYGGEFQAIPVSGKTGQGMEDLEEAIVTLADICDLRAEEDGPTEGWVIESKVTPAGRVATVLVHRGTLRPGDFIVAGNTWARVRTLRDDAGQLVTEAPPGTPVQVDGWRAGDPAAGMEVLQANDEDHAKTVVEFRLEQAEIAQTTSEIAAYNVTRSEDAEARAKVLAWEKEQGFRRKNKPTDNEGFVENTKNTGPKEVNFVIKADVAGSVEAIAAAVSSIGNHEAIANVVYSGTGPVTEFDIKRLASVGEGGYVLSFNQPIDGAMRRLAEAAEIEILDHNIIYKATDVVKEKVSLALPPLITQRVLGEAEVGQVFEISMKKGKHKIAGCKINNGTIARSEKIRVLRDGEVVYTGTLSSLKNVKKDVLEMRKGSECGVAFADWEDFQEGDQIQAFEEKSEARKLY